MDLIIAASAIFVLMLFLCMLWFSLFVKSTAGSFVISCVISAIATIVILTTVQNKQTALEDKWNSGYCPNDGTRWQLISVVPMKSGGYLKYYTCKTCYSEITRR